MAALLRPMPASIWDKSPDHSLPIEDWPDEFALAPRRNRARMKSSQMRTAFFTAFTGHGTTVSFAIPFLS